MATRKRAKSARQIGRLRKEILSLRARLEDLESSVRALKWESPGARQLRGLSPYPT